MSSNVQETIFHIEKLRNVVGVGNSTAYQICTTPGRILGRIGAIEADAGSEAVNEDRHEAAGANGKAAGKAPWFVSLLRVLKR
jgi:hypothetical protein